MDAGISQLPALSSLLRLYKADVNLCNVDGMTPLMVVAAIADSILVNVSFLVSMFLCNCSDRPHL